MFISRYLKIVHNSQILAKIGIKSTINGEIMTKKANNLLLRFVFWLNHHPENGIRGPASYGDLLGTLGQRGGQKWPKIWPKLTINGEKKTKKEYNALLRFIFWLNPQPKKGTGVPASYRDLSGTLGQRRGQKWPKIHY